MAKEGEAERTCIVTREVHPKADLIRFVVGPEGEVVPDLAARLPGKGIYVLASRKLLSEAIERRLFSRAAKSPVSVHEDFEARIERMLRERALQALSLCRKAGAAIAGFDKIEVALAKGEVASLLHAEDASADGTQKLRKYTHNMPVWQVFSREALSQVMGRENAVHVAVLRGPASDFFVSEARRFALFIEKTAL